MIEGAVTDDGVPVVAVEIAGRKWKAVIDTGFNGDLELPEQRMAEVHARRIASIESFLAAGQVVEEELYSVEVPFDGETVRAQATFVAGDLILVGTRLLRSHRLEIDFPAHAVRLERVE